MIYLRSGLFFIGQVVSTIVVSPLAIICLALPSLQRARVISIWARFNIWTLRIVCGNTYRVQGAENIPDQPSVILSNHQSAWETLAFQLIFPANSYILKKVLLWIPFFGWGLAANRPIAINRSKKFSALDQLKRQGCGLLKEGRWLVIFPEGTRIKPGKKVKYQVGGAVVAVHCGAKVLPVAHNAGYFWKKNSFLRYPGVIDVVIGKPIETTDRHPREVNKEAEEWIRATLEKLPSPGDL